MKKKFSLQNFSYVTVDYRLMLVTLFLMKAGQFMLLPFLAIYLAQYTNASASIIGLTVGIGPFVYGSTGIFAGIFVDRFGVKKTLIGSLFLSSIILFFFFYIHSIIWYFFMNVLTGITRTFSDVGSKSYGISDLTVEQRRICFSLRFMVVNSAAAIGPVIGAYFVAIHSLFAFKMIGIIYFILSILSFFILKDTTKNIRIASNKSVTLRESIFILRRDKTLQILLLISMTIWMVYSQLDSTLPQYLHASLNNGVKIYSVLLIINAVMCVSLQILVSKLTSNLDMRIVSYFSMILFSISYAMLAYFLNISLLIFSIVIMTLAEIIIMPFNDLLLSQIAPADRIGTYYGILVSAMMGVGLGPMMGGIIYQYFNAKILFLTCSMSCLFILLLYKYLIKIIALRCNHYHY